MNCRCSEFLDINIPTNDIRVSRETIDVQSPVLLAVSGHVLYELLMIHSITLNPHATEESSLCHYGVMLHYYVILWCYVILLC